MRLRSIVGLGAGVAVGYFLGTAAGRARFEQLKGRADAFVHDPKVQQTVSDLAGQVKANAHHIPSPASGVVGSAAGHSLQLCGDRRPPTARAVLYPQAWTFDLTEGLKSAKGYAKEVTA